MNKLIYIAAPYTHESTGIRVHRFLKVLDLCWSIMKAGDVPLAPTVLGHCLVEFSKDRGEIKEKFGFTGPHWLRLNQKLIEIADEVYILAIDGWNESKGILAELPHFTNKLISLIYKEHGLYEFDHIDWDDLVEEMGRKYSIHLKIWGTLLIINPVDDNIIQESVPGLKNTRARKPFNFG